MSSTTTLLTVEQFAELPDDERSHYELVEGELIFVASGLPVHAWVRDGLGAHVRWFLRHEKLGVVLWEVDCRTGPSTVRRPDLAFFTSDRWRLVDPYRIPIALAPYIAVEVLSPSESAVDVNRKVLEYLAAGSREVWVLDSGNQEIHVRTAEGIRVLRASDLLESPLLPGFSIPVAEALSVPTAP